MWYFKTEALKSSSCLPVLSYSPFHEAGKSPVVATLPGWVPIWIGDQLQRTFSQSHTNMWCGKPSLSPRFRGRWLRSVTQPELIKRENSKVTVPILATCLLLSNKFPFLGLSFPFNRVMKLDQLTNICCVNVYCVSLLVPVKFFSSTNHKEKLSLRKNSFIFSEIPLIDI